MTIIYPRLVDPQLINEAFASLMLNEDHSSTIWTGYFGNVGLSDDSDASSSIESEALSDIDDDSDASSSMGSEALLDSDASSSMESEALWDIDDDSDASSSTESEAYSDASSNVVSYASSIVDLDVMDLNDQPDLPSPLTADNSFLGETIDYYPRRRISGDVFYGMYWSPQL
jgi:hypothetical protein